ncbi:substrate-binding domain-containing protein [Jiangella alba]|uniref:Monosaccharide ABC transporter substrate-binding protein, CUT2 family n=1 Tax=Jiangella alba TaxID=561176 RepID=A0A1H5J9Z3_9ACTN|nr:substrate-binding domain-containing protein [Jiangella alba]SEE49336.1 monosaccharide ABC transporter substrate-binding protein, CUT2 family [Jiangella alba]
MKFSIRATSAVLAAALATATLAGCSTRSGSDDDEAAGNGQTGAGTAELGDASSVQLAVVPGGAHPYFQPWQSAGQAAADDLGLGGFTFNETGEWDQGKQNDALNSLAADGYNAFGIFGVSPTDINTTFADLKSQGFAVASLASCPAGDTNEADFCLSTDVELAAKKAAEAAIEAMGGEGTLVHLTGNNVDSNTQRRIAGVEAAVAEAGGKVELLPAVTDIDVDLGTAQKAVSDLLAAQGDKINAIVTTAYNPAVAAANGVRESGLPIKVVAIDDDQAILDGIEAGDVAATVTQNPVGQVEVGAWVLALLQTGQCSMAEPGVIVDSGSFVVTADTVQSYDQERQAKTEELRTEFEDEHLSCE